MDPTARQSGHPWFVRNKSYKMYSKLINQFSSDAATIRIKVDEAHCCDSMGFLTGFTKQCVVVYLIDS